MTLFQNKYRIESTRFKGWDYASTGSYFVTICTFDRVNLFGRVVKGQMELNQYGNIVNQCWLDLPNHYKNIRLDAFVIMPNHVHGIIIIDNHDFIDNHNFIGGVETGFKPVSTIIPIEPVIPTEPLIPTEPVIPSNTIIPTEPIIPTQNRHGLFEFIRAFKTFSGRRINELRQSQGKPVWQSRFHDHIIQDIDEYYRIKHYIINNPKHLLEY